MSKETSEEIASLAGRVMNWSEETLMGFGWKKTLEDMKSLAASCLAQREDEEFRFGKISMRLARVHGSGEIMPGKLVVTRHDVSDEVSTFVDADWFDRAIINGIFEDFVISIGDDDAKLLGLDELLLTDETVQAQINGDPLPVAQTDEFLEELTSLINRHSIENVSGTPDFLLAPMILQVHNTVATMIRRRDNFYGAKLGPEGLSNEVETNFSFYVDGWTMGPTDQVGEVMVNPPIDMAAAPYILKSRKLTAFLERRLHDGLNPGN